MMMHSIVETPKTLENLHVIELFKLQANRTVIFDLLLLPSTHYRIFFS